MPVPASKTPPEVQLRETLDVLNGVEVGLRAFGGTQHSVCEQLKRVEFRLEGVERVLDRRAGAPVEGRTGAAGDDPAFQTAMHGLEEALHQHAATISSNITRDMGDLRAEVSELSGQISMLRDLEEKTDARNAAFRKEALDRAGHMLGSRPAMIIYALVSLVLVQRAGMQVDSVRDILATLLGVPIPVSSSPADPGPVPTQAEEPVKAEEENGGD